MAEPKTKTKSKYREAPIPESKINIVKQLAELLKTKKTILVASIKNLPAAQLQEISKSMRGKAIIKIPKKNLFFRAIDSIEDGDIVKLKEQFDNSVAILFSDEEGFELSAELLKNKSPAKAKAGQEAPMDIEVPAGPTDLMPGPAISELGALGIQVQIEKGKITIKAPKVIVKEGQKISQEAADVMNKLDIKPFSIGLVPLSVFDNESKKIYLEIKINPEEAVADLKSSYGKVLAFAVEIGHVNKETITFMLGKASAYEKALSALIKTEEPAKKEKEEAPVEEKPAETQTPETKSEENKSQEEKQ
jgi:ribosomal protein L10